MEREIVKIDEDKCTGCGICIPNCHEGALQIIDGKARLVSDLMCDGLGACIGHCPEGAIEIETREAEAYDEVKVMAIMVEKGFNTVVAHLSHLKDHNEMEFLRQGLQYLQANAANLDFSVADVKAAVHNSGGQAPAGGCGGGCPGSAPVMFDAADLKMAGADEAKGSLQSTLQQWPVQLHLVNPNAAYFQQADLLIAADCTAFTLGDFHQNWLKNRSLAIACPKLDQGKEIYLNKMITMIDEAKVNTITVLIMEVPCCGGLLQLVQMATQRASRKVPVKVVTVGIKGAILHEEWI